MEVLAFIFSELLVGSLQRAVQRADPYVAVRLCPDCGSRRLDRALTARARLKLPVLVVLTMVASLAIFLGGIATVGLIVAAFAGLENIVVSLRVITMLGAGLAGMRALIGPLARARKRPPVRCLACGFKFARPVGSSSHQATTSDPVAGRVESRKSGIT